VLLTLDAAVLDVIVPAVITTTDDVLVLDDHVIDDRGGRCLHGHHCAAGCRSGSWWARSAWTFSAITVAFGSIIMVVQTL
jgi:hypothetical protein